MCLALTHYLASSKYRCAKSSEFNSLFCTRFTAGTMQNRIKLRSLGSYKELIIENAWPDKVKLLTDVQTQRHRITTFRS